MSGTDEYRALRRVLRYLGRHRLRLAGGLAATAAGSLVAAVSPLLMRAVVDDAVPARRWDLLTLLTLGLALVPFVRLGFGTLQTLWVNGTAQEVARALRVELVDHLLRLPLGFYAANTTGEVMSRVANDCGRLAAFVSADLVPAAANAVQLAVLVAALLTLNAPLGLAVIAVFPLFHLLGRLVGNRQAAIEGQWGGVRGEGSALLQELLAGVRTIKSFTREPDESARWAAWNARDLGLWLRQAAWSQALAATGQAMVSVGIAVVLGYGGWQVGTGRMSLGTLLAFVALAPQFYATCGALIASHVEIGKLESYMARVFDLLDMAPEQGPLPGTVRRPVGGPPGGGRRRPEGGLVGGPVAAPPTLAGLATASVRPIPPVPGCEVAFERVSFAYEDGRPGLIDVSFWIAPAEFVALVGPSGGGKSTILDLLMAFSLPTAGSITVDGRYVREWPLRELRRAVALVGQDVHVWNASIRDNLAYADGAATEEELRAAARAARLEEFVAGLPHGYDTVVGERGVRLSGAERQRLAIARALLRRPRVLLLDEATAALDALTERALQEGLRPYLEQRTVVAVAHRLSTIMDADRILVVDGGRITQEGPHRALLSQPGLYRELFDAQFRAKPAAV